MDIYDEYGNLVTGSLDQGGISTSANDESKYSQAVNRFQLAVNDLSRQQQMLTMISDQVYWGADANLSTIAEYETILSKLSDAKDSANFWAAFVNVGGSFGLPTVNTSGLAFLPVLAAGGVELSATVVIAGVLAFVAAIAVLHGDVDSFINSYYSDNEQLRAYQAANPGVDFTSGSLAGSLASVGKYALLTVAGVYLAKQFLFGKVK